MKLAFHTNALGIFGWPIGKIAQWARQNGYPAIEVGPLSPCTADELRQAMRETGVEIVTMTYCRNVLDVDAETRETHRRNVLEKVRIAGELGVPIMVTATGRNQRLPLEDSLEPGIEWLGEHVLPLARQLGVKIAIENCPGIGNVAVSPYMWRKLFAALPELSLAYDPSHLVWQMMDPYMALHQFADRVTHVHAKDAEIVQDVLLDKGIEGAGWWRYRLPGWGDVNWTRVVSFLLEAGYTGAISLEHEDPVWEGTEEKVTHALKLGRDLLRSIWDARA